MDSGCTIFVTDDTWRLACVTGQRAQVLDIDSPGDAEVRAKAQRAVELIAGQGAHGPVMLALPSHWCLGAVVDTSGLGRSGRRQAMRYLLEEQLPISAEDSVADFVEHQGAALGVAAEAGRLKPIVEAFEDQGFSVKGIYPAALLVAAGLADRYQAATLIAIKRGQGIDLIEVDRQRPVRWWWLPDESLLHDRVKQCLDATGDSAHQLVTLGVSHSLGRFEGLTPVNADDDTTGYDDLAASQAQQLLAGEVVPWIDLQRDALQAADRYRMFQKQAGLFVAALVFFMVCMIGATWWRSSQYKAYADEMVSQQIKLYKQAMPGQRVPASITSRLQSELRRLAGPGVDNGAPGNANDDALNPTPAMTQLHNVLSAWPDSLRYRISDLTIEPNLIRINGQAADSVVPEQLAAVLRATGVYQVDPPNTRALSEYGFSFGFMARPIASDDNRTNEPEEPGL